MIQNQRFAVTEDRHVIDRLNPSAPIGYYPDGDREDQFHLRERILMVRLGKLVDALIINIQPTQLDEDEQCEAFRNEKYSVEVAILAAISASQLNALDPKVSCENRFGGELKRQKHGLQDYTSLSLFRDDVERLFRDLYGDIDSEALETILRAVFTIIDEFTHYLRSDLWQEHQDAMDRDYIWGVGLADGDCLSSSDHRRAMKAIDQLRARVRNVRENPSIFSKYTVEFAMNHVGRFIKLEKFDVELSELE